MMIKFFLRFLETAGVSKDRLVFRVSIHETADLPAAQRFWQKTVGLSDAQFNRPLIKRHKPQTARKNTGTDYHGCLRVEVRRSIDLYRQIEGWASAVMACQLSAIDIPPAEHLRLGFSAPADPQAIELPGEDSNLG